MLFKPGDVILREKPYAAILDSKEKQKRCDYCFEEFKKLKRCSKCKVMWYCSENCQRLDWKTGHKFTECHVYQICNANKLQKPEKKTFIDYDTPRLLLRFYLFTYYNPNKRFEDHKTFEGKLRCLEWLMEHRADVIDHKDRMLIFEDIKLMFNEANLNFDEELLFRLFCKMYINGYSIMSQMLLEIGRAVFILASQFNHSCIPNAIIQFYGKNIEVRAIEEIDTTNQEILVSYLNVMEKVDKRQELLSLGYYFRCRCERCVFELGEFKNDVLCKCSSAELMNGTRNPAEKTREETTNNVDESKEIKKKDRKLKKNNDIELKDKKKDIKQTDDQEMKYQIRDNVIKITNEKGETIDSQQMKKNENQKEKRIKECIEPVEIIEMKEKEKKDILFEENDKLFDDSKNESDKSRSIIRSPRQTSKYRQNSKSPLPKNNFIRSPLPGNRLRLSKSPLLKMKKEAKLAGKKIDEQSCISTDKQSMDNQIRKEENMIKSIRFIPYTTIELECLAKFDLLNRQFNENVEKKKWLNAYELAKQLHRCYLTYYRDDFSSEITLHLIQMLQIKRNILREKFNLHDEEVKNLFTQLSKYILVTHGAEHQLYKSDYLDLCKTIESTSKLIKNKKK